MKNLFQPEAADEVIARIDRLQPTTAHLWGKMDVAQMMAHCSVTLDTASGRLVLPRVLIGRILGPFVRLQFINDRPFSKNGPTDKKFVIADQRDFAQEQAQLKLRIRQFHDGGEAKIAGNGTRRVDRLERNARHDDRSQSEPAVAAT